MNSGGIKFQRRIGLWVLMISAGLGSYGLGLYQGSAFRMQKIAATEGRKAPVRVLASPAIPEVAPVAAPAAQPAKAVVPAKAAVPGPKTKESKVRQAQTPAPAPKPAPAVVPAAAAAAVTPSPEPSLQPSSISDSPDNTQSPM